MPFATLISLVVFALVIGLLWWLIGLLPLPEPAKQIVSVVFVVLVILALLGFLGGWITFPVSAVR